MDKKITLFATALVTGAILAAFSMNVYGAQITEDDAKTIALDDAGLKEADTLSIRVVPESDDGRQLLEVSFMTEDYEEYEYELLAENGLIYSASYENETASGDPQKTTLEQAEKIAAEHAGKTVDEVTITKSKTERDDGRTSHEIKFYTQEQKQYKYEIDEGTGLIVSWEYEGRDYLIWLKDNQGQDAQGATESGDPADGLEAAKKAALERAGFQDDEVKWGRVHEDFDDGRLIYEGKFFHGTDEYEFEVDAATGEVIEWDMENLLFD